MTVRIGLIASVITLGAVLSILIVGAAPSAQSSSQDDCGKCGGQTPPHALSDTHGNVRWQSDADALGGGDPYTAPHCFVRTIRNNNAAPADFRWEPANWANDRFPAKTEEKKCSVSVGVANPPAKGPITVNTLGKAPTEVWKSVRQLTTSEFSPLTTTLHTTLYLAGGDSVERAIVTFASYVRAPRSDGERFEYTYFIGVRRSGTPAPVASPYQLGFVSPLDVLGEELKKVGRLSIGTLSEPGRVSFTSPSSPIHSEGEIRLLGSDPKHQISIGVEFWRPDTTT
jgi:hypothetical protein